MKGNKAWLVPFVTMVACLTLGRFVVIYLDQRMKDDLIAAYDRHLRTAHSWSHAIMLSLATLALGMMFYVIWMVIKHGWSRRNKEQEGE